MIDVTTTALEFCILTPDYRGGGLVVVSKIIRRPTRLRKRRRIEFSRQFENRRLRALATFMLQIHRFSSGNAQTFDERRSVRPPKTWISQNFTFPK
jgi:hypothetical protein